MPLSDLCIYLSMKLCRVPWTTRWSNPSVLKEINPEYSQEGLRLKLKHQYFGHLMPRAKSLEKTLTLSKTEGRRRKGWQRMGWLDDITSSMDMNLGKLWEMVRNREAWCAVVHGIIQDITEPMKNSNNLSSICLPSILCVCLEQRNSKESWYLFSFSLCMSPFALIPLNIL